MKRRPPQTRSEGIRSCFNIAVSIALLLLLGSPATAQEGRRLCHHEPVDAQVAEATASETPPESVLSAQAEDPHAHHKMMMQAAAPDETRADETRADETRANSLEIPDVTVLDQDGREIRFRTDLIDDKVVAMNFVFTTCTTICPPMGAIFGRLQKDLGERLGEDFHLISVSVDPTVDTPERLKSWAEKFGATEGWTLVTGEKLEVDRLLKALGVFTPDFSEHSPILLVGNATRGEWIRAYGMAPPARIAGLLEEMSSNTEEIETAVATEARGR